uniref:BBSome interacting protein 1 n=2 Tax=Astyanax mexicanus TaxID=7994 RepID=A0A3B1KFT4_ASTMX
MIIMKIYCYYEVDKGEDIQKKQPLYFFNQMCRKPLMSCNEQVRPVGGGSGSLTQTAADLRAEGETGEQISAAEGAMPEVKSMFREVLPKQGQLSMEDVPTMVLCKPKLLPLKSVTLEKLEKMQQEAQEVIKQQEVALREQRQQNQPEPEQ